MTTITRVQGPTRGTGTTSATGTFGSTPTEGNLLVARAKGTGASAAGAISGWTAKKSVQYGVSSGWITLLYKKAGAGESSNVTVSFPSATNTAIEIEEWSNSDGWDDADQDASTATSSGTSKSSGTTGTTTVPDELFLCYAAMGGAVTSPSWNNSVSTDFTEPSGAIVEVGGSKVVSAIGTYESTLIWTTTRYCAALGVTFKGFPAGWTNISKIKGQAVADMAKVCGVALEDIYRVDGVPTYVE